MSVIIPARNEEKNIANCLEAITRQNYPSHLVEIIVVNDQSTDSTASIVAQFAPAVRLINIPASDTSLSPKKKAIETGILASTGDLIVTTDADCTSGPQWLSSIETAYARNNLVIAAPVRITTNKSLLSKFQSLDFLTMQGITGAGISRGIHHMANGANLAYDKKTFFEVGGFSGNEQLASGDDMFLIQKIANKFPGKVCYLKRQEAILDTLPVKNLHEFFQQRIRWAGKAAHYKEEKLIAVLVLVYLTNLMLITLLLSSIFFPISILLFFLLCILKFIMEYPFVRQLTIFFNQQKLLPWLLLLQPLHILYIVVSGFFGQIKSYEWKGRKLK
ncbi:MAG: glycosyltransferase [Gemmatimonadaceae bacterium]|nr:glycosyltransferase [Chitinophagaceae bacterium]